MISISDKSQCCGCNACVQICPKQCIQMQEDGEGFLYPLVDVDMCVDCKLCEKVCPVINQNEPRRPLRVYAAKHPGEDIRLNSSSGGVFTLLAELVIAEGGVVICEHPFKEELDDEQERIAEEAEQDLRDLMNIPDNYKVLFLQGGASSQFAMLPERIPMVFAKCAKKMFSSVHFTVVSV